MRIAEIGFAGVLVLFLAGVSSPVTALTGAQRCEKAKGKAAAKYIHCVGTQRAKESAGRTPDYERCATKLADAFANAESKAAGACAATGDLEQVQARLDSVYDPVNALPRWFSGTRFVDNGDGTVSDTLTGLMWEQKTDDGSVHDTDNLYSWSSTGLAPDGTAFTDFLGELNDCRSPDVVEVSGGFAGYCDWRLPTIFELLAIRLDPFPCAASPCIDESMFGPTQAGIYFSSTANTAGDGAGVWRVFFADGSPILAGKVSNGFVRAVRGGF